MKLLVLGGTKFLGRAFVDAALADGHDVTTFTRGETNPGLFPQAEMLYGDREQDLSALGRREWDAVVDVWAWLPRVVRLSVDALRTRAGRYCFVSSISAYRDFRRPPVEGAPVATTGSDEETLENYGAFKAQCERIVEDAFGERALIVRPGLIVGPHDPTGRFTYWVRRIARGGDVLAPGTPDDAVQFIDVRDLGGWLSRAVQAGLASLYNATGLSMPFGELLDACARATGSDAHIVWVPSAELIDAGVGQWMELPLWIADEEYRCMQQADVAKALAAGLTLRPLEQTIRATLAHGPPPPEGVGLAPEREAELLGHA